MFIAIYFPVYPRNQFKSFGLEMVLSHTEKSWIESYYKQIFTDNKIKNPKINTSFESCL